MTSWTVAHRAPPSMGILQARILQWVAMPSSRASSLLGIKAVPPASPCTGRQLLLPLAPPKKPHHHSLISVPFHHLPKETLYSLAVTAPSAFSQHLATSDLLSLCICFFCITYINTIIQYVTFKKMNYLFGCTES